MIDLIITTVFVALVVSIWILRNNAEKDLKEMLEKRPPVVILTKNSDNVRINNEPVVNNVYADSDIETQQPPVSISEETSKTVPATFTDDNGTDVYEEKVIGDEIPDNNIVEEPVKETKEESVEPEPKKEIPVVDYASITDYFSGKLNTLETVDNGGEEKEANQEQTKESETVIWSGDALQNERASRTVILADELIAGDAYVYYRQNLSRELFKGIIIADKRMDDDLNNGVVRARYARQAIGSDYRKGFIMRTTELSSLKFYKATQEEIAEFLSGRPADRDDLEYILGPYKDKYV